MAKTSDRYKNNVHLPKAGLEKNFNIDQISELKKCMEDPVYFAVKYFKIVSIDHGLIPFKLYSYQKDAIKKFTKSRNLIINASRQSGKTSIVTVLILHTALFNDRKTIAILANKAPTAQEILKRVKMAYEHLPDFLKGGVKKWNEKSVEFENGSEILAEASSSDNIRGKSVFMLYIDELAFVEGWDDFSASVLPTLSSGKSSKIVFSSTPNGLNHYYYYVKNARAKKNNFDIIEVPWDLVPGRNEKWKQKTLEDLNNDEQKFAQEYELEFLGSSGTLISGQALRGMDPINPIKYDDNLKVYEKPVDGKVYVLVADVSRGKGLDHSAFQVIDVSQTPYKQVASYRNNLIVPADYAEVIYRVAMNYNYAQVLVENNDLGQQVVDIVYDLDYDEIIYTENRGRGGKTVSAAGGERGVRTSKQVKSLGCATLKLLIEEGHLDIKDQETINELNTFSKKGSSYEAEAGNHDDLVMCLVLFAWLSTQPYFKDLVDIDIMRLIREKDDDMIYDDLAPFGIINTGRDDKRQQYELEDNWEIVEEDDRFSMGYF